MSDLTIIDNDAVSTERKVKDIDPTLVKINAEGWCWREMQVRLPAGFTLDDLKENIWGRVQSSGATAFRKLDRVRLIEYNELWVAETIVAAATDRGATLAKPQVWQLPERHEYLFQDETYAIVWVGQGGGGGNSGGYGGYRVRRKKDNVLVTPFTPSKAQAERDLRNLYPSPAA